jgi:NSS family neurotransmitter:Na+ symporter
MAGARGNWNSNFGFIMAAVGSAVGLGNLVRFPKELANNGGAAFLLVYLVLLLLVGLPAILGEMTLGKITQMSPVNAFRKLGDGAGKKWGILGVAGMMAACLVLFYYAVMTGWTLRFFFATFTDGWYSDPNGFFGDIAHGPGAILWLAIVAVIVIYVVSRGISGGIEKVTSIIMPALFGIIFVMVIYALFQPGMGAGYARIFKPDFSAMSPSNVSAAVGQVFFSMSLGQGAMLTYASYMEKKQSVSISGTQIALADTGVAVLAAMMIFPTLAFTGLLTEFGNAGTFGMAFEAMPNAFVSMGPVTGRLLGGIFFLGLFFAAFSSAISLLEVPVSVVVDNMKITRAKAAMIVGGVVYIFAVVSAINEHWFELFDLLAVNVFIVVGVAITTFFAGWIAKGVGKELDVGLRSRVGTYLVWMMRTVTPVLILFAFFFGGLVGTGADGALEFFGDGTAGGSATEAKFHEFWRVLNEAIGTWEE